MTQTLSIDDAMTQLENAAHRMTAEQSAADAISTARTKLVLSRDAKSAFFATLALRLKFKADWSVPTADVDGRRIRYNPDFVLSLSESDRIGLLAHEVMHVTCKHFARRADRDPQLWNVACDLAINPLLVDAGISVPGCGLYPGRGEYADLPVGLSAEEYYAALRDDSPDENNGDSDDSGEAGDDAQDPADSQNSPGSDGDSEQPGGSGETGNPDPGGSGGVCDPTTDDGQPVDDATLAQVDAEVSVQIAAARQAAQRRGELSAGMERLINAILAPAVDWKQQLREFVQPARKDYSWKRANRRHIHRGLHLPALRSEELGEIVAAIDTSGSIDDATLARFATELDDIARLGAQRITIVYHDSAVVRVDQWTPDDGPLTLTPCGGGGTDHRPVFEWMEAHDGQPEVILLLTDLYSRFPADPPAIPVVWVATSAAMDHPFGDRINIPAE